MTLTPSLEVGGLVSNTLAAGAGVIYTALSGVMVKDLRYFCTANAPQTVVTYVTKSTGTREHYSTAELTLVGYRQTLPEKGQTLCLNVGDIIEAVATSAASVEWAMSDLVST